MIDISFDSKDVARRALSIFLGFVVGYLAIIGFCYVLNEWMFFSALQRKREIEQVIRDMVPEKGPTIQ